MLGLGPDRPVTLVRLLIPLWEGTKDLTLSVNFFRSPVVTAAGPARRIAHE